MVALARLPLASALCVAFMPMRRRMGPLTTTNGALPPVLAVQPCSPNSGAAHRSHEREHDRHVFGQAPRHHRGDRHLLRGDAAAAHRLDGDHVGRREPHGREEAAHQGLRSAARWAGRRSGPRAGTARWPRRHRPPPRTTTRAPDPSCVRPPGDCRAPRGSGRDGRRAPSCSSCVAASQSAPRGSITPPERTP